ncbi:hypothetical protein ABMA27_002660 [Loxostege sticticalis]|uniref:Uncharacterized protein n=1 Tax=Loxostege sticticalis TaxID=481309 RepID=A0ABR3HUF1_LOXSC
MKFTALFMMIMTVLSLLMRTFGKIPIYVEINSLFSLETYLLISNIKAQFHRFQIKS